MMRPPSRDEIYDELESAFFRGDRFLTGFVGAGSSVAWRTTNRVEKTRRPCSSNSMTVWCSLTSTSVPAPYVGCTTRSPFDHDFIAFVYQRGSRRPPPPEPPRLPRPKPPPPNPPPSVFGRASFTVKL